MSKYEDFVASKLRDDPASGFTPGELSASLFPFQRDLVRWALKRGRAAIFADTGLGKSRMQLEWARQVAAHENGPVLVLAPLAVAAQTVREAAAIGVRAVHAREEADAGDAPVVVTNYERVHKFDLSRYVGVVLDESSCIKHHNSKTLATLLKAFEKTKYKLCATATPAPNDFVELGTHAEFLGACSRAEMLAEFFVHDGSSTQDWRLKGHARAHFWRWVSTWGALMRRPSDLGYDDAGYALPTLHVHKHVLPNPPGYVAPETMGLSERRAARRESVLARVAACAAVIAAEPEEQWLVWGDLNAETELLCDVTGGVEVAGPDDPDEKEARLLDFAEGRTSVLVTKPTIAGWGLNFQRCARMAFIGVSDSFEQYYQAVRRCWRFRQEREVHVHLFASEAERAVLDNLERKEADARAMADALAEETRESVKSEVQRAAKNHATYAAEKAVERPRFLKGRAS